MFFFPFYLIDRSYQKKFNFLCIPRGIEMFGGYANFLHHHTGLRTVTIFLWVDMFLAVPLKYFARLVKRNNIHMYLIF